jgi:hypothetical protein
VESKEFKRVPCNDGCCIGTVNEKGFCSVCGKLRNTGRLQEKDLPIYYPSSGTAEANRKWDIDDIVTGILKGVLYIIVILVILGILLFLAFTFLRVGWKFIKWAWE